ncbi:hypothetical protein Xind_00683 [Xenorhabdus indica]|nr:hypothetical protein [Xenorhabdus indica]
MNTVEKGNKFENEVFLLIQEYVNSGNTWLNPDLCTFHQKKPYSSKERESNIIVDISIECFIKGKEKYSQLVIIECKNYSGSIPVDDIEEFNSKMRQIAGSNVKGMFFSNSQYQKSAFTVAKNTGIALARILPGSKIEWILERKPISVNKIVREKEDSSISIEALLNPNFIANSQNIFSYYDGLFTSSFIDLFNKFIFNGTRIEKYINHGKVKIAKNKTHNNLIYLGYNELDKITSSLLNKSSCHNSVSPIDLTKLMSYMKEIYSVNFIFTEDLGKHDIKGLVLGCMDLKNRLHFVNFADKTNFHVIQRGSCYTS